MGFGLGGGSSSSRSSASERLWEPQGDALKDAYGRSQDLLDDTSVYDRMRDRGQQHSGYNDQIMGDVQGGMQNLIGGGSMGRTDELKNSLMSNMDRSNNSPSNMSNMYQSIVGGAGNTYIDPMVAAMKEGGMDNLNRMQSNAGLDASHMGQSGSSRHAMQNAMLGKEANRDMLAQESAMRGGAYDKDLMMKMNIAKMADTNQQSNMDRQFDMLKQADLNTQAGMGYGQNAQNLAQGDIDMQRGIQEAQWSPTMWNRNLIGDDTILGQSSGSSSGWNAGMTM